MSKTVADFTFERLAAWGVRRIFGYPGDGISGYVASIGKMEPGDENAIEFIQTRHEETAAFMACGHAKFTGEVGVCLATSGPGAIHLLNGLYDAKLDHRPVVAIVGQQSRAALGGHYQQEVDLVSLFKDVASDYVHMCVAPEQMRHLIDRAVRIALSKRTVTCIIVPDDVQHLDAVESPPMEHGTIHSGTGYRAPKTVPEIRDLRRAADILNQAERPAILVGAGALGATDEVIALAESLGAGVAKALLGRAAVPDDLPFVTGAMGLLGTEPSDWMMRHCDVLLMIGSGFPYSEFLPDPGKVRGIQIDIDPALLSIRFPMEVPLVGDSAATIEALLPLLDGAPREDWRKRIERRVADWWDSVEVKSTLEADPVNPEHVFRELSPRLPDHAIISADSGSSANWFARALKIRRGMMASLSGTLATMCPGIPYATAAKFAHPERVSIAFVGDGAMQMLGLNGLITIAKYWRNWSDPRLIVCVLNNGDLNQVTWELRAMADSPKVDETQEIPDFPYACFAESIGLNGIEVQRPEDVGPAWEKALSAKKPTVIDAHVDPNVPTLPPHITVSQAKSYASALIKGDPNAGGILWQTFKRLTT